MYIFYFFVYIKLPCSLHQHCVILICNCEDDSFPFPWTRSKKSPPRSASPSGAIPCCYEASASRSGKVDLSKTATIPESGSDSCRSVGQTALECIEYKVPTKVFSAGLVLRHARQIIDCLFKRHAPMIFKIGFTSKPAWRWENPTYGYAHDRDQWSRMVIVYETDEPFGPAMLEAALIDLYRSFLVIFYGYIRVHFCEGTLLKTLWP